MVKILDCTLRDGGYVNNWDFSDECILETIVCAEKSGIEYIEIGYKVPSCVQKSNINFGVMLNAKEYYRGIDLGFCNFVRVACYPDEIEKALLACEDFYNKGLCVFLHLMTADKFEKYDLLKNYKNKEIFESVYFADTFGSFMPNDVEKIYKNLQACGFEKISFHAHNNLQLAFTNTIRAIELGAYSVDASVLGMGRGAGNLPIEVLLKYLEKDNTKYLSLLEKYYLSIFAKNFWGYNYKSLVSGLKNIHP